MDTGESALHFWDHEFCHFEDRVPIGAFGAHTCALKIWWNAQKLSKIIKKSIFSKKNILWINVPGSSSNVLGMFSAHLWPVKCSEVIWHWWRVFQQFHQQMFIHKMFFFWKNRFFDDFRPFLSISTNFERAGARAKCSDRRAIFKMTKFMISEV